MSDLRKDQLPLFEEKPMAHRSKSARKEARKKSAVRTTAPEAPTEGKDVSGADPGEQALVVPVPVGRPRNERVVPASTGSIRAQTTGELYLFPQETRATRDLHFSRRMSDLVRRLQLLEREAKSSLGLTLPQAHAIHALNDAASLRMQELAETLGLAQSTVTRLVTPLKRMGLLDRRPDRDDGRATRAFLTDKGTASVDELERKERDLYQEVLDHLPETRRAEVIAAIELLHEAVRDITLE
ncbi:MAG: MarR family winged helix-turn-helix transcriptional regulator [Myxococcota bacterium]|nr:MarR family winged helix-turn-helix transcriptional regulator [Myxococcota bacterium]